MTFRVVPFTDLLSAVVDNRGRTCPLGEPGRPLIATNCVKNTGLYPTYDTVRYVDDETYSTWFRSHPMPGDILFVCKGAPGTVAMVPDPVDFCIAQDMVAVRADASRVYPRYLFAALRSGEVQSQIAAMHVGTMIPHFKKGDFDKLLIPLPPPSVQQAVGDTYVELSLKIESNRRIASIAQHLADAVFSDSVAASRPLQDVAEVVMGSSPPGSTYNEDGRGLPFYQGVADFGFRFPRRRVFCDRPVRIAEGGDALVSVRAPVGRLNRASERCCIGRGLAAVRSSTPRTLFYALRAAGDVWAPYNAEGTVFGAIKASDLQAVRVPWPADETLSVCEDELSAIDNRLSVALRETGALTALRDSLLPELLSGRLQARDTAAALEGLA